MLGTPAPALRSGRDALHLDRRRRGAAAAQAKAALAMSAPTLRILAREVRRGRTEIDVRATIGTRTATARVRIRAR
jgi:hypothetical protein